MTTVGVFIVFLINEILINSHINSRIDIGRATSNRLSFCSIEINKPLNVSVDGLNTNCNVIEEISEEHLE